MYIFFDKKVCKKYTKIPCCYQPADKISMTKKISITVLALGILFSPLAVHSTEGTVVFGPYLQRMTNNAVTIMLYTATPEKLTLSYKASDTDDWQTITDEYNYFLHRYRITNINPSETVTYYFSDDTEPLTSEYSFEMHGSKTTDTPLRMIVFGDSGTGNDVQAELTAQMAAWEPSILLHTGDIAYDSGTVSELINTFFLPYQELLAVTPFYGTMGNHDYTTENGAPYKQFFETPLAAGGKEDYYAFNLDGVHFISLNSNLPYTTDSKMYRWLEGDLKRTAAAWTIVFFHHPIFSSGPHGSTSDMDTTLLPLFSQYGVDLVLNGHDHAYERNAAVDGVTTIVTGGGSAPLYTQTTDNPHSVVFNSIYHFLGLTITDTEITVDAIDADGVTFDHFTLEKN